MMMPWPKLPNHRLEQILEEEELILGLVYEAVYITGIRKVLVSNSKKQYYDK